MLSLHSVYDHHGQYIYIYMYIRKKIVSMQNLKSARSTRKNKSDFPTNSNLHHLATQYIRAFVVFILSFSSEFSFSDVLSFFSSEFRFSEVYSFFFRIQIF
ncbi:hypothetical protein EGW08_014138 [Elysia chlorotica]|uniref:Uncharacterized protein n=1 Tax=Elysia chlorotica TaxID=188477 RepID=A0A3S0ZHW2_ELYCH|nr:hypothetical protein EGW08_014138 [Elysia chlorotica]